MGFRTEAKSASAGTDAQRAASEGRSVFLYRYVVPATMPGFSGPVGGAAEVVEAVEAHGWRVADMAYDSAQSKNGAVLLLFRR